MTNQEVKRKLTAIFSADVKGYSRLMGEDEKGTLHTLNVYKEVMSNLIQHHHGRVVDAPGDNVLAEFASVVDAVECAVEIQKELKTRNAELPENRRMEFRIGINLGDVIEEEGKIFGDGVNIAARLESLSEAGGICVTGIVYDQVKNKLTLKYEFLGEQTVKNISEPVRVYRVKMDSDTMGLGLERRPDLPEEPSIAVLPFVNMSGDPEQEYFSDGITEEIITGLSKVPRLIVIARNSAFTYKGKSVKVQQVGQELGVRYVLEGSVRRAGDRVRITAQLVDAATGRHLWAEQYDREMKDIFALQDEITIRILTAMRVKLTEGEQARREEGRGLQNLDFWLKVLEGSGYLQRFNIESNILARGIAEEAIALSPESSAGYYLLAFTHMMDCWLGSTKSPQETIEKAIELVRKSLALDDTLAQPHGLLSHLYSLKGEHEKAIAEGERAVALDPGGADVHAWYAMSLTYACKPEEAIPLLQKAIRLNPFGPTWYFLHFGNALRMAERFEEALLAYKRALQVSPDNIIAHMALAITYSMMSREREARAEAAEVLRLHPKFSLDYFTKISVYKEQSVIDNIIEALRKSGLK